MLLTVTLNPAIDLHFKVKSINFDQPLRCTEFEKSQGGKGINVSFVAKEMGAKSIALSILGGHTGKDLLALAKKNGIALHYIRVEKETRTNIVVTESETGKRLKINSPGALLSTKEFQRFDFLFHKFLKEAKMIAISGKLPPGLPPDTYARMIKAAKRRNIPVILDTEGEPLKFGIEMQPFMIKPNKEEFEYLIGRKINNLNDLIDSGKHLLRSGPELIVVSNASAPCVALSEKECWVAYPSQDVPCKAVGAGDALVAGMATAFLDNKNLREALKLGVAYGTASALTPYPHLFNKNLVSELLLKTKIEKI